MTQKESNGYNYNDWLSGLMLFIAWAIIMWAFLFGISAESQCYTSPDDYTVIKGNPGISNSSLTSFSIGETRIITNYSPNYNDFTLTYQSGTTLYVSVHFDSYNGIDIAELPASMDWNTVQISFNYNKVQWIQFSASGNTPNDASWIVIQSVCFDIQPTPVRIKVIQTETKRGWKNVTEKQNISSK